jgi:hypothetical protein
MKQVIGAIAVLAAFVLALHRCERLAAVALIIVGLLDLYIIWKKEITISTYVRSISPWNVDCIILVGLVPVCLFVCGWEPAVWFTLGLLNAHFFNIEK